MEGRRRFGRLDRFDLRRAVLLWKKQVLGLHLARIEETNQRLSRKLLASRTEQLTRNEEIDAMKRIMNNMSKQERPLEASAHAMRQQLCVSLDGQIERTTVTYIEKRLKIDLMANIPDEAKPGDICSSVTVLIGKEELVMNLSAGLTFSQLLKDALEYWNLAHGSSSSSYHLIEAEHNQSGWSSSPKDLNPMSVTYLPPNALVQSFYVELKKEPRVRMVQAGMPGYESLRAFNPRSCFNLIKSIQDIGSNKDDEDIFARFVLPHIWALLWIIVILLLSLAVVLEVVVTNDYRLHLAIEVPAQDITYEGQSFDGISTWRGAVKYLYINARSFNDVNSASSTFRGNLLSMDEFIILRQHRSTTGDGSCCVLPSFASNDNSTCYCNYDLTHRSKADYGTSDEFRYYDTGVRSRTTYFGREATYGSSGFYVMLNSSVASTDKVPGLELDLDKLIDNKFVDEHTRAVIAKTRFVNKHTGLLATQVFLFEFDVSGFITPSYIFISQPLKGGTEWDRYVALFWFNVALNVCSISLLFLDASAIKKEAARNGEKKRSLLATIWRSKYTFMQAGVNLLLICAMILKIIVMSQTLHVDNVIESQKYDDDTALEKWPTDLVWVAMLQNSALIVDSFSLFLTMGVLLDKLRIFSTFWVHVRTIELSSAPFQQITLILTSYCVMLALVANVCFGSYVEEFSSYSKSLLVMMRVMLGQYVEATDLHASIAGLLFMVIFVFPLFWIFCSVFFAVLLDAYWIAHEDFQELCQPKYRKVMQLQIFQMLAMVNKVRELRNAEKIPYLDVSKEMHKSIIDEGDDSDDGDAPPSDDEPPDNDEKKIMPDFRWKDGCLEIDEPDKAGDDATEAG